MAKEASGTEPLVVVGAQNGITLIPSGTPLTRLNYYDGKFLRAADLQTEQGYLRQLVALSNQGGGAGVVHGLDTTLAGGETLRIGPGLAVDPAGRTLLLPTAATVNVRELLETSRGAPSPEAGGGVTPKAGQRLEACEVVTGGGTTGALPDTTLYAIVLCHAEALCGEEDVFGRLCEEACVTSTDRPYRMEGLVVRALPLVLRTPLRTSKAVPLDPRVHLRSLVAASLFEDERLGNPALISRDGLRSGAWCLGAGYDPRGCEVPLAVLARVGGSNLWLDPWSLRRERIEAPARRFWAWRMRMRPWDVFLAQVLQFQCQLAHVLAEGGDTPGGRPEPCKPEREMLAETARALQELQARLESMTGARSRLGEVGALAQPLLELGNLKSRIQARLAERALSPASAGTRLLVDGGIIELPPAGYLPVLASSTVTVNEQVRALLGPGVDLRFCVVRADFVGHALEAAQHMERISLLQGLDDPSDRPQVDILVPDGRLLTSPVAPSARLYEASVQLAVSSSAFTGGTATGPGSAPFAGQSTGLVLQGAAREERLAAGGGAIHAAGNGVSAVSLGKLAATVVERLAAVRPVSAGLGAPGSGTPSGTDEREPSGFASLVGGLFAAMSAAPNSGGWLTARCEQNVAELTPFQQTPVMGRVVFAVFGQEPAAIDASFSGAFTVTSRTPPAGGSGLIVEGIFAAMMAVARIRNQPSGQTETVGTHRDSVRARVSFSGDTLDGSIVVDFYELTNPTRPVLRLRRDGQPHAVSYQLLTPEQSSSNVPLSFKEIARLSLGENPAVANPGNASHQRAEAALDLIQATLIQDPAFRRSAEAALFPPLPPQSEELTVQAVRDWVLFHRRRTRQCAPQPAERPEALPPRRYQLFEHKADSREQADKIASELQAMLGDPARHAELLRTLIERARGFPVEYEGGSSQPRFDPFSVELAWRQLQPGALITFAMLGSKGDPNELLQRARLLRLEEAIARTSKADADTVVLPIVPFPDTLTPPGAEGMVVLLTIDVTTCQQVLAVPLPRDPTGALDEAPWNNLVKAINTGTSADIAAALEAAKAKPLGQINFQPGGSVIADGSAQAVGQQYDTLSKEQAIHAAVWVEGSDPDPALHSARGQAIRSALGGRISSNATLVTLPSQADVPPPCPSILLLAVPVTSEVVTRRALVMPALMLDANTRRPNPEMPRVEVTFRNAAIQGTELQVMLANDLLKRTYHWFDRVFLATKAPAIDPAADTRAGAVLAAVQQAGMAPPPTAGPLAKAVGVLTEADRKQLQRFGIDLSNVDDVIFLEGRETPG